MARLLNLSTEILSMIIDETTSIRDLASLSVQCRRLHMLIDMPTRQIYHQVSLTSYEEVSHSFGLLLEILKDKRLAKHVRKLKIYGPSCRFQPRVGSKDTPIEAGKTDEDVVKRVREAARAVGFIDEKEIEQILDCVVERRNIDANTLAVMFMSACPNIECLELYFDPRNYSWRATHLENFLRGANSTISSHLRNLREVHLLYSTRGLRYDPRFYTKYDLLGALICFHRLPSIERISMDGMALHDQRGIKRLAPQRSNITRIYLGHSSLDTEHLCAMIDHCKTLEEFSYATGGRASINGTTSIRREAMGHSISRHASTLRVLDLDIHIRSAGYWSPADDAQPFDSDKIGYNEDYASDDPELRDFSLAEYISFKKIPRPPQPETAFAIGSLRDFTALTHLSIDVHFFVDQGCGNSDGDDKPASLADRLPPNLEYLCLRGYKEGEDKHSTQCVYELQAHMAAGNLPRLKEVHGITECIPIAEDVRDPDNDVQLLWNGPNDLYRS